MACKNKSPCLNAGCADSVIGFRSSRFLCGGVRAFRSKLNEMNAYLFTGWISQFQRGHLVDSCSNLIVCGADNQVAAQQFLEQCLLSPNTAEEPTPTKVERVVGAPLLDQLLTETGPGPLNWEEIVAEAQKDWESSELDDSELGYWLDCNPYVEASRLAIDIEQLRNFGRACPRTCGRV